MPSKLMHTKQGSKPFTQFTKEIEEIAVQWQFTEKPYTFERAWKGAIIFGTSDDKLRQEALAKFLIGPPYEKQLLVMNSPEKTVDRWRHQWRTHVVSTPK